MPRPGSKVDWRRSGDDTRPARGRLIRRIVFSLVLVTLAGILIWLLLPPSYPEAHFVSLSVTEYDIELPPIAVFPKDIDRFEESAYAGKFDRLDPLQTSEAIGRLGGRLRGIVSKDDTLILYVAAHGVSDRGVPYLLCSDFLRLKGDDDGRIELTQFLAHVIECPAKLKLIVLDVGHIASDPRLGMVVNEFPRLLAKEIEKLDDPTLWVLSSNRSMETTHVSHGMRRSIFSHYVSLALRGDADKTGNLDGRIDLAELSHFVRSGVVDWVSRQTDRASSQTPLLLKSGTGVVVADDLTDPPFLQLATRDVEEDESGGDETVSALPPPPATRYLASYFDRSQAIGLTQSTPTTKTEPTESDVEAVVAKPSDAADTTEPEDTPQPVKSAKPEEPTIPEEPTKPEEPAKPEETDESNSNDVRLRRLLEDAWAVRDRMQVRNASEPWSPVDYAPHLWREYQAFLLGYELRSRRGTLLDEQKLAALEDLTRSGDLASHIGRNTVLGRLADARSEFLDGDACRGFDQSPPDLESITEAVMLQNDLLFAMPDYIHWHAEHSRLSLGDRSLGQTINRLLDELADLVDLLESLSPSTSTNVPSRTNRRQLLTELTERTERLRALRDDVNIDQMEGEVLDLLDAPTAPGAAARIEAILSTPLLPGPSRTRLLEALVRTDHTPPEVSSPNRPDNDSLAARKPTWDALREQAYLEEKLVLLADPGHRFSLSVEDFTRPRNREDEEKLWGEYGLFGSELGAFYRSLPARINALVEKTVEHTVEGESTQDEGRPKRLIRLVDARDVRRMLDRSLTNVCLPAIDWARFETVRPGVEAPSTITLVRDDWVPLELQFEVTGSQAEEVSYRLDYNPAQVRVENVDRGILATRGRWRPVILGTVGHQTLHLRVRCDEEPRGFDPILVCLRADGEETIHQITPHLPSPDVVDLVIERITGTASATVREADRFATVLVDQPEDDGAASLVRCRAFSNRSTEYRMALVNRSGRPRKVVVDLLTVQTRLAFDPSSRPDPFDRFGRLAVGFTRLAGPLDVELPADDSLTPIPFPDPKAAEKRTSETGGVTPSLPGPPPANDPVDTPHAGPLVTHGILCLMRDEQSDGAWSRWIDFSPVAPREYLQADVHYSKARRRISIKLAPLAGSRVLPPLSDAEPISIAWDTAGVLPPGTRMKTATKIANVTHTADLDALIDPDVTRSVEVRLSVDDYPRAFVFHAFPTNRDKSQAEINLDLRRVEIVSPVSGEAFLVPLESPLFAAIHLDAPTDAFRKSGDVLEVGIDQNDDRSLGDDEKRDFFADRYVEIRLERLSPGGIVEVFTLVRDFEIALDPAGLTNTLVDIKADLRLNNRLEASSSVSIVLDGARPLFDRLIVPTRPVAHGSEVEVRAQLSDTSGVKVVQFGFDGNNSNTLDDDEKLEELFRPNDGDAWRALLPTDALKPSRTYTLIVLAVDRVGLSAKQTRPLAIGKPVVVAADTPAEPAPPKNSVLHGQLFMKNPDERIPWTAPNVLIEENGRSAKPDRWGVFTFDDLPQGNYTLIARGMAGNRILEGKKTATVTEEEARVFIHMKKPE